MRRPLDTRAGRSRLRALCADERGYVLVLVLAVMGVALAAGAALLAQTLSANQLTSRDTRVRRAQQAADAGIQAEIYQQSETNLGASYNFNGGVLGLSNLLDCDVPQINASLQITGTLSLNAGTGGVCPEAENGSNQATALTTPIGDHAYYQAELVPNEQQFLHGSSGGSSSEDLLFPEIVSIGCDANSITSCENGVSSPTADYSREELILAPIAPLQAIEGMGNVTLNGLSALGLSAAVTVNGDVQAIGKLTTPLVVAGISTSLTSSGLLPTFAASSFGGTIVSTAQMVTATPCQAGVPSTTCIIQRQPVTLSNSTCTPCASLPSGDYSSTGPHAHEFSMSSGTVSLTAGQYVFCNFNATGGTLNVTSGPVQIFIASPTSALCSPNGYTETAGVWNGGNFNAADGINNLLTGTVNGVVNAVDPSELQIYDLGDGNGYDNATSVKVGDTATCKLLVLGICTVANTPVTQAMVVYAPTSAVSINTGTCLVGLLGSCTLGIAGVFEGSVVGDNTTVTASAITQDLDIGNFPLYSGVNAFRPVEYVQCDTSVTKLSVSTSDVNGC